jgi:exopolysaccharide biosynthesis protein
MNHAKERTYRNIVGQNNNGDIVIIASKFNGLVTIAEIIEEANKFNLKNAILYDGGSSVDYYFDNGEFSVGFDSSPKIISKLLSLGEPTTYLTID